MKLCDSKSRNRYILILSVLITGFIACFFIMYRNMPPPKFRLLMIDRADINHRRWALNEFILPSRQTIPLHVFPADTLPFYVTYAPLERRIGVLMSRDGQLEFDLLDRSGKLLKQIALPALAESVARPYYRNGQFFVSTPDRLLYITAKDGDLNTIDVEGRFPQPIYELLQNYPRTFMPDSTRSQYSFCYGPEVRTPRPGNRGHTISPPASGQVYTYSVQTGKISKTSVSAIDLIPAHKTQFAYYDSKLPHGCQIKIMATGQSLVGQFAATQRRSALRWSPADTQIVGWDEHSFTCYSVPKGEILYRAPMEFSAEDWDCMTEYEVPSKEASALPKNLPTSKR